MLQGTMIADAFSFDNDLKYTSFHQKSSLNRQKIFHSFISFKVGST